MSVGAWNRLSWKGVTIVSAQEVHESTPAAVAARVREVVGEGPAYLSFDIDCLDPAYAPGTGTQWVWTYRLSIATGPPPASVMIG